MTVLSVIAKTFPFVVLMVELYGCNERVLFAQLTITNRFFEAHLFFAKFYSTVSRNAIYSELDDNLVLVNYVHLQQSDSINLTF